MRQPGHERHPARSRKPSGEYVGGPMHAEIHARPADAGGDDGRERERRGAARSGRTAADTSASAANVDSDWVACPDGNAAARRARQPQVHRRPGADRRRSWRASTARSRPPRSRSAVQPACGRRGRSARSPRPRPAAAAPSGCRWSTARAPRWSATTHDDPPDHDVIDRSNPVDPSGRSARPSSSPRTYRGSERRRPNDSATSPPASAAVRDPSSQPAHVQMFAPDDRLAGSIR